MKVYEITSVDTGRTVQITQREAYKLFGKAQFVEMLMGYLPNLIVVQK